MQRELVVREPGKETRRVPLPESMPVLIGRGADCDVRIEDPRASARHARLRISGSEVVLEDLGSSNGTAVNGTECQRRALAPGDRIEIGSTTLELAIRGAVAGGRSPQEGRTSPQAVPGPGAGPDPSSAGGDLRLLQTLSALLNLEDRSPEEWLPELLDGLIEGFGADRGAVLVPGAAGLEIACRRIRPGSRLDDREPISRQVVARVAEEGTPLLMDPRETEALKREIRTVAGGLVCLVAVPMELPDSGGTGVLYLDSALDRRGFRTSDREVLMAFARTASGILARERASRSVVRKNERLTELQRRAIAAEEILGTSGPMRSVLAEVGNAASADVTVLVSGESGTGKELVARALHRAGPRREQTFVAVNCAALPADLVESELFGYEKGAFTGADARRLGQFELADGGTLFLDEVGELPPGAQGKLLRALQERRIQRLGGSQPVPVDFRLVCATNVDLKEAVASGRFREDLFYRIAVFRIFLPPLRKRGDDVLLIAEAFVKRFAREFRRDLRGLDEATRRILVEHRWPGNIRELRNVIEQAVVRETSDRLTPRSVLPALGRDPYASVADAGEAPAAPGVEGPRDFSGGFEEARKAFERQYLTHHLERNQGNMKATSEAIGLSRKALYLKCQEYGIDYDRFR